MSIGSSRGRGRALSNSFPIVERLPLSDEEALGLRLSLPPALDGRAGENEKQVTPWSVEPGRFGDFMIKVFDEWVRNDVGSVFVMNFEWTLSAWMGLGGGVCIHARTCGDCLVIEHNGDIYACDHYVYPAYKRGNILSDALDRLVGPKNRQGSGP